MTEGRYSPILFNIVVEKVIRDMNIEPREGVKFQKTSLGYWPMQMI